MKRRAVLLLLLVAGGAIINVVVAWGCCMFGYRNSLANVALRRTANDVEMAWWRRSIRLRA